MYLSLYRYMYISLSLVSISICAPAIRRVVVSARSFPAANALSWTAAREVKSSEGSRSPSARNRGRFLWRRYFWWYSSASQNWPQTNKRNDVV